MKPSQQLFVLPAAFFLALAVFHNALADSQSFLIANAMVPYIGATHAMSELKRSSCGYALSSKEYDTDNVKREILNSLNKSDKKSAEEYFRSDQFQEILSYAEDNVRELLIFGNRNGMDEKTYCGVVIGTLNNAYFKSSLDWKNALTKYKSK